MANKLQHKRGTTAKRLAYTPAEGEIIHDQTLNKIFIGNGTTAGGVAIQADDDSRIPKMESLSGGKRYAELVQRYYASASQVGAMVIHLPVAKATTNTMLMVNVRGYNYQTNFAPFDLMVGFYQYAPSNSILQFGASCNGVFPGERVRIGRAADHTVIILGDVGTVWSYPTLRVAELIASYGSQDGWESGWSINCETDLSGYVNLVEPILYGSSRAKKADTLTTARTIGGVSFDGTANINLPGVNIEGNQNTTGNAATASKLQTLRTINAVDFDGSENIVLGQVIRQGVDWDTLLDPNNYSVQTTSGTNRPVTNFGTLTVTGLGSRVTQTFTTDDTIPSIYVRMALAGVWNPWEKMLSENNGVALAAKKLETPVNINGVAFDGTANINTPVFSTGNAGLVPARVGSVATKYLREDGTWVTPTNTTYSAMTQAEIDAGTGTTARIISPSLLKSAVLKHAPAPGTDNALFLGSVMWFNGHRAAVPDGYATADGQILNRSDHPGLWSAIDGGRFVSVNDAVWTLDPLVRASYSTGNGTSTFRLPDLNGVQENSLKGSFLRGDGLGNVDLAGKMQGDAIRNITGEVGNFRQDSATYYTFSGAFSKGVNKLAWNGSANVSGTTALFDASRVVPTANENRPVSSVGVWIIRVSGATSPLPAAGSPATLLANVFNGSQKIVGGLEVTGDINLGGQSLTNILNTLPMLGVGQTWQNMIGQRASGTIYQNTTGKPIAVVIGGASSEQQAQCSADSVTWVNVGNVGKSGSFIASTTFIVPNQHYYRITAGVGVWSELR